MLIKRIIAVIAAAAALALFFALPPLEAGSIPRLIDNVGLVDYDAGAGLRGRFDEISERQGCDVAVLIDDKFNGDEAQNVFAEFSSDGRYGYGETGRCIVMLIGMAPARGMYIGTNGLDDMLTMDDLQKIASVVGPELSSENFTGAVERFAESADELLTRILKK